MAVVAPRQGLGDGAYTARSPHATLVPKWDRHNWAVPTTRNGKIERFHRAAAGRLPTVGSRIGRAAQRGGCRELVSSPGPDISVAKRPGSSISILGSVRVANERSMAPAFLRRAGISISGARRAFGAGATFHVKHELGRESQTGVLFPRRNRAVLRCSASYDTAARLALLT